jgi:hypothetical protein
MQTTEIFVEQVLIGLLVLFTGWLFVGRKPELCGDVKDIEIAILILGTSYLLGILCDRFADTLLQNLDQHYRLAIAIKRAEKKAIESPGWQGDPFPEEQLRLSILREGPGLAEYASYLRSRIRLSRALASILPALSVGYGVYLLRSERPGAHAVRYAWLPVTIVYLSVFVLNLLNIPEELPKTNVPNDARSAKWRWSAMHRSRKNFDTYSEYKREHSKKSFSWQWQVAIWEPAIWGVLSLFLFTLYLVSTTTTRDLRMIPPASLVVTWLTGWVWYRIEWTRLTLLSAFADQTEKASIDRPFR